MTRPECEVDAVSFSPSDADWAEYQEWCDNVAAEEEAREIDEVNMELMAC